MNWMQSAGPFSREMKKCDDDIAATMKRVSDLTGIRESDTGLAPPALWDLAADRLLLQSEQPLQVHLSPYYSIHFLRLFMFSYFHLFIPRKFHQFSYFLFIPPKFLATCILYWCLTCPKSTGGASDKDHQKAGRWRGQRGEIRHQCETICQVCGRSRRHGGTNRHRGGHACRVCSFSLLEYSLLNPFARSPPFFITHNVDWCSLFTPFARTFLRKAQEMLNERVYQERNRRHSTSLSALFVYYM